MAELEITIDPKGNVTSKTDGVKGRKCLEVDDFLKELGKV